MVITAKTDVKYDLDESLRLEIMKIRDLISENLKMANIYIYGSIAKGRYSKTSDIDVLVLIDDEKTLKELRCIRHDIEERICDLGLSRDVDLKLYTKVRYCELIKIPSFESSILEDLVEVEGWQYG